MKKYIGTKLVQATPMTRQAYNDYRGWKLPEDEAHLWNEDGFLVEYLDGGRANDDRHQGYISWSPADVFQKSYKIAETYIDRMNIEVNEINERKEKLQEFIFKHPMFFEMSDYDQQLMKTQLAAMVTYQSILELRIQSTKSKS